MQISAKTLLHDIEHFININKLKSCHQLSSSHKRSRFSKISDAKVVSILILYQFSGYRTFKYFYESHVKKSLKRTFPEAPSYSWFLRRQRSVMVIMLAYFQTLKGKNTGIYFMDSTHIKVCHNRRIHSHKTFESLAMRGHCSVGWFYGFKLHLLINDEGELIEAFFTKGNEDDRIGLEKMPDIIEGLLVADKGYISKKHEEKLKQQGLKLITKTRKNMKPKTLTKKEKHYLYKRGIIETVIGIIKNIFHLENTRARSIANHAQNMLAALIAYALKPLKPIVNAYVNELKRS